MFYFEHLLNTALAAIDGTRVIPTITNIAFAILLIGFLVGLYQAALRGGDLQALAVTSIKYVTKYADLEFESRSRILHP